MSDRRATPRAAQVIQTFQKAQELGLTVLRMWAFADGPNEWNALQPELELLDDRVLTYAALNPVPNPGRQSAHVFCSKPYTPRRDVVCSLVLSPGSSLSLNFIPCQVCAAAWPPPGKHISGFTGSKWS